MTKIWLIDQMAQRRYGPFKTIDEANAKGRDLAIEEHLFNALAENSKVWRRMNYQLLPIANLWRD